MQIAHNTTNGELASFNQQLLGITMLLWNTPVFVTDETLINPFAELVIFMSPRIISIVEPDNADDATELSGDKLREYLDE